MRPLLMGISLLALINGLAPAVEAEPVNELEADGTASNNSLATAQAIPPSAFTLPVPPTVFDPPGFRTASLFGVAGGPDVDIFQISGHGTLLLDVDQAVNGISSFDTWLILFDSSGVSLAAADDSFSVDDGSVSSHDSRILFDLPGPGVYFVAVSGFGNTSCAGPGCTVDTSWFPNGPQPIDDQDAGRYLLFLSLEHPHRVPMPLTLALLVCSRGLVLGARLLGRRAA